MSNEIIIGNQAPIKGELTPPGDKSISHRSVIIGSLAKGTSIVRGFLDCDDANSSINAMKMLGVPIEARRSSLGSKRKRAPRINQTPGHD